MWKKIFNIKNAEHDDFVKRIRSLVIGEGMLREGNISSMDLAIKNMPNEGNVLEIGSYGGLSTNLIIYLMNKHQKINPFFTCDAWIYEGYSDHLQESPELHIDGRKDITRADYSAYIKNAFIHSVKFLSPNELPFSFHLYSDLFFEKWEKHETSTDVFGRNITLGGPISFAYIDGGHSYDVAWNDFNNVNSHLVKYGFILLDDSADGQHFGSAQIMDIIKKDKRFKVIAKNPNYLIQKVE
jgi:Methyltransferase domain